MGGSCVPGSQVLVGGWVGGVSNTPSAFLMLLEEDESRTKAGADWCHPAPAFAGPSWGWKG